MKIPTSMAELETLLDSEFTALTDDIGEALDDNLAEAVKDIKDKMLEDGKELVTGGLDQDDYEELFGRRVEALRSLAGAAVGIVQQKLLEAVKKLVERFVL